MKVNEVNLENPAHEHGPAPVSMARWPIPPNLGFQGVVKTAAFESAAATSAGADPSARHTVERGENLWGIVRDRLKAANGASPSVADISAAVNRVAQANGLSDPDLLRVGQNLDLSPAGGGVSKATSSPSAPVRPSRDPFAPLAVAHAGEAAASSIRSTSASGAADAGALGVTGRIGSVKSSNSNGLQTTVRDDRRPDLLSILSLGKSRATLDRQTQRTSRIARLIDAWEGKPTEDSRLQAASSSTPSRGVGGPTHDASAALSGAGASGVRGAMDVTALLERILGRRAVGEQGAEAGPWAKVLEGSGRLASEYGMRRDPFSGYPEHHDGIDIAAASGTRILAQRDGRVVHSGWESGYGRSVHIVHDNGSETVYGHNLMNLARVGEKVREGEAIALVGSSGRSTGPHLHFEMRINGRAVDPRPFLSAAPSLHVAKAP